MDNQSGATMDCCFGDMGGEVPVASSDLRSGSSSGGDGTPQTEAELAALRRCVQRGSPFGEGAWCDQIVRRLGLESTLRPQGRPKKRENGS
jgi:hypothetical protein